MKKLLLTSALLIILFSCKKEDKTTPTIADPPNDRHVKLSVYNSLYVAYRINGLKTTVPCDSTWNYEADFKKGDIVEIEGKSKKGILSLYILMNSDTINYSHGMEGYTWALYSVLP